MQAITTSSLLPESRSCVYVCCRLYTGLRSTARTKAQQCRRPFLGTARLSGAYRIRNQVLKRQQQQICRIWPFDLAWGASVDIRAQDVASNFFAFSIIPYAGFLYHLTKSKQAPGLTLFGFYFLLVFVFATIPAGIYAKTVMHTSLSNVDWLHGPAESLLTITNLLIVLGMRQGIREAEAQQGPVSRLEADAQQDAEAEVEAEK